MAELLSDFLPGVGALRRILDDAAARQRAATGEVIRQLAADVGYELFERTLSENPRLRSLFLNSMEAAYRTGLESKRWLFGRLVKDAILDEYRFDHSWLMSQALSEIDAPHIVALEKLRRLDQQWEAQLAESAEEMRRLELGEEPAPPPPLPDDTWTPNWWDVAGAEWLSLPTPIRATLIRTGLAIESVAPTEQYGGPSKRLTEFGEDLLKMLPPSVGRDRGTDNTP